MNIVMNINWEMNPLGIGTISKDTSYRVPLGFVIPFINEYVSTVNGMTGDVLITTDTIGAVSNGMFEEYSKDLDEKLDTKILEVDTKIDTEVSNLNSTIVALDISTNGKINSLNSKVDTETQAIRSEISELNTSLSETIEELESNTSEGFVEVNNRIDEETNTLNSTISNGLATLDNKIDSEVVTLNQEINGLDTSFTGKLNTLESKHDLDISNLSSELKDSIGLVDGKHTLNFDNLSSEVHTLESLHASDIIRVEGEIETVKLNHSSDVQTLRSEIQSTSTSLEASLLNELGNVEQSKENKLPFDDEENNYLSGKRTFINIFSKTFNKLNNLSDLLDASEARNNLGLGSSATKDVGSVEGTVAAGNDLRLLNAVQKVTGKDLSSNDFTDTYKEKIEILKENLSSGYYLAGDGKYYELPEGVDVSAELSGKVDKTTNITAGTGLDGGGNLFNNLSLSVKYGDVAGTAVQGNDTRIVNAVQKEVGKGLSTNDYTNTDKSKVNLIQTNVGQSRYLSGDGTYQLLPTGVDISGKVDKEAGKGLSTNDYTDTDKTKVSKIVTDGVGDKYLSDDGSYKEVSSGVDISGKVDKSTKVIVGKGMTGGGTLDNDVSLGISFGNSADTVTEGNDSRLTNSREWTAATITQAEAEAGTATTRRAWTAQRVRQSFDAMTTPFTRTILARETAAQVRSDLGLDNASTVDIVQTTGQSNDAVMSQKAVTDALSIKLNTNGNAATATKLRLARTINLSGDVTGSKSFDGSFDVVINTTLKKGLGIEQTWQDVKESRAYNTTYTNSSGKPILVAVTHQGGNGLITYKVNNIPISTRVALLDSDTFYYGDTFLVPNNMAYQVTTTESDVVLYSWMELR